MKIPFSAEQFFEVFARYNQAVWPAQWIFLALAVAALVAVYCRFGVASRLTSGVLAVLWLWTGAVYHWSFFAAINPAAVAFGGLFLVQAAIFFVLGVAGNRFTFQMSRATHSVLGPALIAYALVVYPALGHAFGHVYPASPTFGAPCPTTIFTLGVMLLAQGTMPLWVFVIPSLWSVVGFNAALAFGVYEDVGLLLAALVAVTASALLRRRQPKPAG